MTQRLLHTSQTMVEALKGHEPRRLKAPGSRRAAVLVPLVDTNGQVEMLFTKRNSSLPHHPGQISFPGGAADPEDDNLAETALRETCEEIGVCEGLVEVVARLDQVLTVTDFLVTPFLGLVGGQGVYRPNPVEVERLLLVPLAKVLDPGAWGPHLVHWQGLSFNHVALPHEGELIWGATARMLRNLLEALGDKAAEVAQAAQARV